VCIFLLKTLDGFKVHSSHALSLFSDVMISRRDSWCVWRSRCIFTTSVTWRCCTQSATLPPTRSASVLCRQTMTTATWRTLAAIRVAASRYSTQSTWSARLLSCHCDLHVFLKLTLLLCCLVYIVFSLIWILSCNNALSSSQTKLNAEFNKWQSEKNY